jgi:YHS domain-containing protein
MMKRLMASGVALAAVAALLLSASFTSAEEEKDKLKDVKCPVSGKQVVADKTAEYKEGVVYFCCPGCPKPFAADTAKYAAKANHQLVQTGQYEATKCPIAGRPINPDTAIDIAGVQVAFCCPNCKGKAEKAEGDAQIDLVFNDKAFEKAFAPVKKDN